MKKYIKFCTKNSLKPSTFGALQVYKSKSRMKETPEDRKIRLIQLRLAKLQQIKLLAELKKIKNEKSD